MKIEDKKYQNQMISVDVSLFAIKGNKLNVLLVQRNKDPYLGMYSLIGGGVYNDETCENAVKRELDEKLNIKKITAFLAGVFSDPKRDIRFRNISISYFSLVNEKDFHYEKNSPKVTGAQWYAMDELPKLAFDHKEILKQSLSNLQEKVYDIAFIKNFIPTPFSLGGLQKIYESILQTPLDKRNFRRKLNSLDCLKDTGLKNEHDPRKKSALYTFKKKNIDK